MSDEVQQKIAKEKTVVECLNELQRAVEIMLKFCETIKDKDLPEALRAFKLVKDNREYLDNISKVVDKQFDLLSHDIIPKMMEDAGVDSLATNGYNFIRGERLLVSIDKSLLENDEPKAFQWLQSNGLESIIKREVNAKTLTSAINTMIETEAKSPSTEDGFKIYSQPYMSVRKQ